MAFDYVLIQLQTKFILKVIKIVSIYNIIWKVILRGDHTILKKIYFCLDCKFADRLLSVKPTFRVKKGREIYIKNILY